MLRETTTGRGAWVVSTSDFIVVYALKGRSKVKELELKSEVRFERCRKSWSIGVRVRIHRRKKFIVMPVSGAAVGVGNKKRKILKHWLCFLLTLRYDRVFLICFPSHSTFYVIRPFLNGDIDLHSKLEKKSESASRVDVKENKKKWMIEVWVGRRSLEAAVRVESWESLVGAKKLRDWSMSWEFEWEYQKSWFRVGSRKSEKSKNFFTYCIMYFWVTDLSKWKIPLTCGQPHHQVRGQICFPVIFHNSYKIS